MWLYYAMAMSVSASVSVSSVCGHKRFSLCFDVVNRFISYFEILIPSMRFGVGLIFGV